MGFLKFIKSLFSGSKKESLPLPVIETPVVQKTKVEEPIVEVTETVSDKTEEIAQVEEIKEVVKTEEVKEVKTEEKKKTAKEIKARVRKPAAPKSDEAAPKNKPKPRRRNKNKKAE